MSRRFGWRSGTLSCQDAKIKGDLYVQDDIVFSDVSAGALGVTGGIDMQNTTSAIGIDLGGTFSTAAINIDGTCSTAGIVIAGGSSYNPIHIGVKDNVKNKGLVLTGVLDDMGGVMIFCDDGGVDLTNSWSTSPIWTRYLITETQTSNTATGAYLQLKLHEALNLTSCDYSAVKAYLEVTGATTLTTANLNVINCGLELGESGVITDTAEGLSGIDVNINDGTNALSVEKNSAGVRIRKTSGSTAGWPIGLYIEDTGATTGIEIGNATTGIKLDGTFTTGIKMEGNGESYNPIVIGTKSNDPDKGINMTGAVQDNMMGVMIFCDDSEEDLTNSWSTSPIWTRYAITANQTSNTATGAYLQLKMVGARTLESCDYSAVKAYLECSGTVGLTTASLSVINAGLELGGNVTGILSGIDVNTKGAYSLTAGSAGVLIRKTSGSTAWPIGLKIQDDGTATAINIGTCTTGISFTGTTSRALDFATAAGAAKTGDKGSTAGGYITIYVDGATRYINCVTGA